VVTASADGRGSVFKAKSGTILATLIEHQDDVTDAVCDSMTIVSASLDGTARLWDRCRTYARVRRRHRRDHLARVQSQRRIFASAE
jgi:WD40 repeat protein